MADNLAAVPALVLVPVLVLALVLAQALALVLALVQVLALVSVQVSESVQDSEQETVVPEPVLPLSPGRGFRRVPCGSNPYRGHTERAW